MSDTESINLQMPVDPAFAQFINDELIAPWLAHQPQPLTVMYGGDDRVEAVVIMKGKVTVYGE